MSVKLARLAIKVSQWCEEFPGVIETSNKGVWESYLTYMSQKNNPDVVEVLQ